VAPLVTLKNKTQSARMYRHQLILVVEADGIELLHWGRGWTGWALQRAISKPRGVAAENSDSLAATLREVLAACPVPAGTPVALVLPPLTGGLSLLPDASVELTAAMPFQPAETVHAVMPPATTKWPRGLFWLHRDNVEEYIDLLGAHNLHLADIFARGQLAAAYLSPSELRAGAAVIEQNGTATALHLYLPGGTPFRSACLPAGDTPLQRAGRVAAELAAASAREQCIGTVCVVGDVILPNDFPSSIDAAVVIREALGLSALAERLWFSPIEGIWLPPPRAALLSGFNRWAIGIAVAGAALFIAMLWQTDRYEKQSGEFRTAVKKLKPGYDRAVQLEKEAVRTSETLRGVGDIERLPRSLDPLASLAEQLPAGAWLTRYAYQQGAVRIAGYAPDAEAVRERFATLPGLSAVRAVELPPVREGVDKPFAFEAAWRPLSPNPAGVAAERKGE